MIRRLRQKLTVRLVGVDGRAAGAVYRAGVVAGNNYCHHNVAVLLEEQDRSDEGRQHYLFAAAGGDVLAQRPIAELDEI